MNAVEVPAKTIRELIETPLAETLALVEKTTPQTKKVTKYVNIEDVKPAALIDFMKANSIPDDAWFGGKPNGYDAFDQVCLCYEVEVPTTEAEQLKHKRRVFGDRAFPLVYEALTQNGYKRVGFNSGLLDRYKDTTVYDMYVTGILPD